jgi:CheY-like chemotaxis protein
MSIARLWNALNVIGRSTYSSTEGILMPQSKASLLLVDDDAALRWTLAATFSALGYSVRSAADGFGALSLIREEMPDIILSDLQMPGMSGFELLYIVQRRFPAIRVVAMSGAYSGEGIPEGVAAHAFHAKGSNPKSLFDMIEAVAGNNDESLQKTPDVTLIWIAQNIHDCSGRAYVLIGCPECLRTFPELLVQEPAVHGAHCIYCGTSIRYAIVQQADYLLSAPTGTQLGHGIGSRRDLSNGSWNLPSS